jgi:WD40 repeat protein
MKSDPQAFADPKFIRGEEPDNYTSCNTTSEVSVIAVSADGRHVAAGSLGGVVVLWDTLALLN